MRLFFIRQSVSHHGVPEWSLQNTWTLSYLTESEHLARSFLEEDSDLRQVGGGLHEEASLRAAGWNAAR